MMIISDGLEKALEEEDPNIRIKNILLYIFGAVQADPVFWEVFYSLRSQPAVMEVLGNEFRLWTAQVRDLLVSNLKEAGWKNPDMEALVLFSLIEGTIQQHLLDPTDYPIDSIIELIIQRYHISPK
jgi:hypothetical protein